MMMDFSSSSSSIKPLQLNNGLLLTTTTTTTKNHQSSQRTRINNKTTTILRRIVSSHPGALRICGGSSSSSSSEAVSITTVLERNNVTGKIRVAVYNGPTDSSSCREQQLHASFLLDTTATTTATSRTTSTTTTTTAAGGGEMEVVEEDHEPIDICWASFPTSTASTTKKNHHPLLCVLTNPTHLCIWDVYPDNNNNNIDNNANDDDEDNSNSNNTSNQQQQRGTASLFSTESSWTVALPFECCRIFALPCGGGLLLQRQVGSEDEQVVLILEQQQQVQLSSFEMKEEQEQQHDDDDDDGFFLQSPPIKNNKQGAAAGSAAAAGSSSDAAETAQQQQQQQQQKEATAAAAASASAAMLVDNEQPVLMAPVASLFTLQHPLEDVVPVCCLKHEEEEEEEEEQATTTAAAEEQKQQTTAAEDHEKEQEHTTILPMTDVWESVLWVGCADWTTISPTSTTDDDSQPPQQKQQQKQVLAVTYHTRERRHAIWLINDAPPPPPVLPLYQRTRQWVAAASSGASSGNRIDEWELYGRQQNQSSNNISYLNPLMPPDHAGWMASADAAASFPLEAEASLDVTTTVGMGGVTATTTRDEALASALGVSRQRTLTPRKSMERRSIGAPTAAAVTAAAAVNSGGSGGAAGGHHHAETTSFFSPRSEPGAMTLDSTQLSALETSMGGRSNATTLASSAAVPFAALHASVSVQCIYRESEGSSSSPTKAENIFLLSNPEASGTLLLCLVGVENASQPNPNQIRFFQLEPTPSSSSTSKMKIDDDHEMTGISNDDAPTSSIILPHSECYWKVHYLSEATAQCRSSQPIQSAPIPACFVDHNNRQSKMATDLLLSRDGQSSLFLCRGHIPIVPLQLSLNDTNNNTSQGPEIFDALFDTASLTIGGGGGGGVMPTVRTQVSLQTISALAERVLRVWDAALVGGGSTSVHQHQQYSRLGLLLRSDVCRLEQYLQLQSNITITEGLPQDMGFLAVQAVLLSILDWELGMSSPGPHPQKENNQRNSWERLLDSDFHHSYSLVHQNNLFLGPNLASKAEKDDTAAAIRALFNIQSLSLQYLKEKGKSATTKIIPCLFDAIHWLLEECKLTAACMATDVPRLVSLMLRVVFRVDPHNRSLSSFREYYIRSLNNEQNAVKESLPSVSSPVRMEQITSFSEPPSLFLWVENVIRGKHATNLSKMVGVTGSINPACSRILSVVRILSTLFASGTNTKQDGPTGIRRDLDVVNILIEEGFSETSLIQRDLPPGIALPILEVLYRCRNNTDPSLADLPGWSSSAWRLVGREDLSKNMNRNRARSGIGQGDINKDDQDNDGLVPLEKSSSLLFPEDNRIHEAARLLRSSRPIFLRVNRAVEVSDHDYERLKQKKLLILSKRALALPVGRGMLSLGSLHPVAASETLPIPELCLRGRVPPTNASLQLDDSECPPDMRVWPEFHNGVAAGLRLPLANESENGFKMTRTWIVYNRPPTNNSQPQNDNGGDLSQQQQLQQRLSHTHGGLLLALGLRGHLTSLEMSDIYEYLTLGSVTTTVGVLLGMACNMCGSCDMAVSKMLCLHIPSLIPQHFSAIDVASTVQSAAIIGAGLLFQSSSHRMMTEFLLNEIGKRPETDASATDRESYTLSCGLALGMVNLRLGEVSDNRRAAGIADLRVEERLYRYMVGGVDDDECRRRRETNDRFSLPTASPNGDNERCSTIFEGDLINTDITAAGATLALGLMYMKTGNQTIASALGLPDTHFLLEFVRPDFLALRVVSRALILWDDVEPTRKWIDSQIPEVVRAAYKEMEFQAKKAMEDVTAANPTKSSHRHVEHYDRRAIRQVHANLIAGACFGLGLRFAGTGDERAKAALFERVLELQTLREGNDAVSAACRPEFPILDTCLGCAAISLAMVLAGTGDLDALKLFKILRWRCEDDSRYGHHMAYSMAIGLLFLGGGTCTLGREPEDLAALVTAFFPRFPTKTSDNQFHLQALRHLYALATRQQELGLVDVDTGEPVHLPVEISRPRSSGSIAATETMKLSVPCLLRNSDSPYEELKVTSDKYYPIKICLDLQPEHSSRQHHSNIFYVKKRSNFHQDPTSSLTLLSSPLLQGNSSKIAYSRTDNAYLRAYAKYMLRPSDQPDFYSRALQACVNKDSEEVLALYQSLLGSNDGVSPPTSNVAWDLRLLRTYYQERSRFLEVNDNDNDLLDVDLLLAYLHEKAERGMASTSDGPTSDAATRCALSFYDDL